MCCQTLREIPALDLWFSLFVIQCVQLFNDSGYHILSSSMHVLSGVPPGSDFSPTLFNIIINDALSVISSKSTLYSDNLKLLGPALSCEDPAQLQNFFLGFPLSPVNNEQHLGKDLCILSLNRPISLLLIISKVVEKIVYCRLSPFAFSTKVTPGNFLITNHQYGFCPTFSTLYALSDETEFLCVLIWIRACVFWVYFLIFQRPLIWLTTLFFCLNYLYLECMESH